MPAESQFKVVIVGGSIAGLTLAHCLDAVGIDYVVLEKRAEIAPRIGASVSLMPNGSRILDQLGLFDKVSENIEPCVFMQTWTGNGKLLSETNAPILTSKRLGYTITFLERESLLQILYDSLPDKAKVLANKGVKHIQQDESQATVFCDDGSKFIGDVVAGADGIHSRVRSELQRFINKEGNDEDLEALKRDQGALSARYSCLFGISSPTKGCEIGHTHRSSAQGASTLLFGGENGRVYWFLFTENSETTYGESIPRYKKEDELNHAAKFMHHHVNGNALFGDLWKNRVVSNFVPIEEMVSEHWVWNRIACLGDSVHKMTPNLGQGANCAIESAAELANYLARIRRSDKTSPTFHNVTGALKSYHLKRHIRANQIVHAANKFTRVEAMAERGDYIASMYILPRLGDILADRGAKVQIGAVKLDTFPMPDRALRGTMCWSENAGIGKEENRKTRQKLAVLFPALLAYFWWQSRAARATFAVDLESVLRTGVIYVPFGTDITLLRNYTGWNALDNVISKGVAKFMLTWEPKPMQTLAYLIAGSNHLSLVVIWLIESFRRGNILTVANIFPNIMLLLSQFSSMALISPLYFFFHYTQSPQENYAALDNRLTNMAFVKIAVPLALLLVSPALLLFGEQPRSIQWVYGCFGYLYPVIIALMTRGLMLVTTDTTSHDRLYRPLADLPYLRLIYASCGLLCGLLHVYGLLESPVPILSSIISNMRRYMLVGAHGPVTAAELRDFAFICTFAGVFYWILLSFADLKAAGRLKASWVGILCVLVVVTGLLGPGSAMLLMWAWREEIMATKLSV